MYIVTLLWTALGIAHIQMLTTSCILTSCLPVFFSTSLMSSHSGKESARLFQVEADRRNQLDSACKISGNDLLLSGLMHSDATNSAIRAAAREKRKYTYTLCDECVVYSVVAVAPPP
jgi:hypothetical protein